MEWEEEFRLEYNRNEIRKKLRELAAAAYGYDASILPYITDRKGAYSDRKTMSFIKALLPGKDTDPESGASGDVMTVQEREFYTSFLYCAIRCFANEWVSRFSVYERFEPCDSFRHLLEKAELARKDAAFSNYNALIRTEYDTMILLPELEDYEPMIGFFAMMDRCFCLITGEAITGIDEAAFGKIPREEPTYHVPEFSDEDRLAAAKAHGFSSYEEWNAYEVKQHEESPEVAMEAQEALAELEEEEEEVCRLNEERFPAWETYKDSFAYPEKFIRHYKRYRELFFKVPHTDIFEKTEKMVTNFLYEKDMLPYIDDDVMTDELINLKRSASRLKRGIARRRKNG